MQLCCVCIQDISQQPPGPLTDPAVVTLNMVSHLQVHPQSVHAVDPATQVHMFCCSCMQSLLAAVVKCILGKFVQSKQICCANILSALDECIAYWY